MKERCQGGGPPFVEIGVEVIQQEERRFPPPIPESNLRAQEMFKSAIGLDKGFAAAYAELSDALFIASNYGWSDGTAALQDAVTAARQAITLDPSLPQGYTRLASALAFQHKLDEAIVAARRAVALDSNYATGYARLSMVLVFSGATDESLAAAGKAVALDPYSFVAMFMRGQAYFLSGHYEQAAADFRSSLAINPDFGAGHGDVGREEIAGRTTRLVVGQRRARLSRRSAAAVGRSGLRLSCLAVPRQADTLA